MGVLALELEVLAIQSEVCDLEGELPNFRLDPLPFLPDFFWGHDASRGDVLVAPAHRLASRADFLDERFERGEVERSEEPEIVAVESDDDGVHAERR